MGAVVTCGCVSLEGESVIRLRDKVLYDWRWTFAPYGVVLGRVWLHCLRDILFGTCARVCCYDQL